MNGGIAVDMKKSIYVGDAAGRPKDWKPKKKKDFSCGDRSFAFNVGVDFKTPEEFFLNEKPVAFSWDSIDAKSVIDQTKGKAVIEGRDLLKISSDTQEMVICVGRPASGKSTFSKKYLVSKGYEHINRDTLKTKEKCHKIADEALSKGKSVVIDNTSPSAADRNYFITLANDHNVPVRCFVFQTPKEISEHLNFMREKMSLGTIRRVPDVAFNKFKSSYQEPTLGEGFTEVLKVEFVPDFEGEQHQKWFNQKLC